MQLKLLQKKSISAEIVGNWITKVSKSSPQNNLEIVGSEAENKEIPKERYISSEKRQQVIDDLRLV